MTLLLGLRKVLPIFSFIYINFTSFWSSGIRSSDSLWNLKIVSCLKLKKIIFKTNLKLWLVFQLNLLFDILFFSVWFSKSIYCSIVLHHLANYHFHDSVITLCSGLGIFDGIIVQFRFDVCSTLDDSDIQNTHLMIMPCRTDCYY